MTHLRDHLLQSLLLWATTVRKGRRGGGLVPELRSTATNYGTDGGSSSMGTIFLMVMAPAVPVAAVFCEVVPAMAVFPAAWIPVLVAVTVKHALIQLRNPSGSAIYRMDHEQPADNPRGRKLGC